MYLSLLDTEQKKLFLSLANNLAACDGDFSESENQLIKSYANEMNMEFNFVEVDNDIEHIVQCINDISEIREKKIIIFEMIGLAMADYNYDDSERKIVKKAISVFGLEADFDVFCENKLKEYFSLQEELNSKILS